VCRADEEEERDQVMSSIDCGEGLYNWDPWRRVQVSQHLQMDKSRGNTGITGLEYHKRVSVTHSNIDEMSAIAFSCPASRKEDECRRAELKLCDRRGGEQITDLNCGRTV
jgi:hypothetical protein